MHETHSRMARVRQSPLIVMGLGILFGGGPTVWHYFNPWNGPVVLMWYGTVSGWRRSWLTHDDLLGSGSMTLGFAEIAAVLTAGQCAGAAIDG